MASKMKKPVEMMAPADDKGEPHEHEIDDAVRTLERGEEIKKDKRLMPHVHKKISKKIHSLKDLKALAGQKSLEEQDEMD